MAAEHVVGKSAAQALEGFANRLVPGLTDEPAWPTLRARLLLLAAEGADPDERLRDACEAKELSSADDRAAVLDWRLDNASPRSSRDGPLPWLPGIPDRIAADPTWGPYLDARSRLVTQLADQVRLTADGVGWAEPHAAVPAELIADVQVWRAATQVDPSDLRPTGPLQLGRAARIFQQPTRQATRHCGYRRGLAMAAIARHRSPKCDRRSIPAGADRKVEQPQPGRFRRQPARAVGGRRRTPT